MNWQHELQLAIDSTSSALKTSRVAAATPSTSAYTSSWQHRRPPLALAQHTTTAHNPTNTSNAPSENQPTSNPTAKQHVSQKLLLQDVSAVKSAVVQVAAEVGKHAQSSVETNNNLQRLGDNQEAHREMMSGMRQRVINIETQRAQQDALVADLRRACEGLRQQYSHLQSSINERATRGEVSASIQATVGPVRAQVESALQHYSEGLATATATAAAAVHAANDAKRRSISNRMTNASVSMMNDPELSMMRGSNSSNNSSNTGGRGGEDNVEGRGRVGSQHDQLMNSIDIIEARVERRMLRSVEDKIELELSRATDKRNVMNFDDDVVGGGSGGGGRHRHADPNSHVYKEWQLGLEGKVQECFQRVLEMGGKLAEESQRRHLAIAASRAETRIEGKRIDELTAQVVVAEKDMKDTTLALQENNEQHPGGGGGGAEAMQQMVDNSLQQFLTSNSFAAAIQEAMNKEINGRVKTAVSGGRVLVWWWWWFGGGGGVVVVVLCFAGLMLFSFHCCWALGRFKH